MHSIQPTHSSIHLLAVIGEREAGNSMAQATPNHLIRGGQPLAYNSDALEHYRAVVLHGESRSPAIYGEILSYMAIYLVMNDMEIAHDILPVPSPLNHSSSTHERTTTRTQIIDAHTWLLENGIDLL